MTLSLAELGGQERLGPAQAKSGPMVRAPVRVMFMWSSSTPCLAEKWPPTVAAWRQRTLFAQTDTPTSLLQTLHPALQRLPPQYGRAE
jgi:hypothetical protein